MKSYSSRNTNVGILISGLVFSTLAALSIVPGLDILAWHFLHPAGFWQKLILAAIEVFTLWPRVMLALLVWGLGFTFTAAVSE